MTEVKGKFYDRVVKTLKKEKPDSLPFVTRLEIWHLGLSRQGSLPEPYQEEELLDIHADVGVGLEKYFYITNVKLNGVEMIARFNGEVYRHEKDPIVDTFPRVYSVVDYSKPGRTEIEFITPKGTVTVVHEQIESLIRDGMVGYLKEGPFKSNDDYPAFEYIIENSEFVYMYDEYRAYQESLKGIGYAVPFTERVPFQQLLIDVVGEIPLFYMLKDDPAMFQRLMSLLDENVTRALKGLKDFEGHVIEFGDNLESMMTNPKLFRQYSLPHYQKYADIVRDFGLITSSHTDGNLGPLLELLKESGLGICESISPMPLTQYTFEDIWEGFRDGGPIIWGGIPSPILEERTSEKEFLAYVDRVFEIIDEPRIMLGVGDMVLPNNAIERVRHISERAEAHRFS